MPIYSRLKHEKETVSVEHRQAEVELVNARVTKTKKEIEELKAQLQQLISDGIKKTNFTETKQNIVTLSDEYKNGTYNEESPVGKKSESVVSSAANVNKARSFKDSIADIIGNVNEVDRSVPVRLSTSSLKSKSDLQDDVTRKVRHYDQESARKYMEKQKQKRKELMNNQKHENADLQQIKKQRLEDLRRKSQELLSKNVKKRAVQKEDKNNINQESAKYLSSGHAVHKETMQKSKSENVFSSQNKSFKMSRPELKNITFRSPNKDYLSAIAILNETKRELEREKAAIKIQSAFRCYCQRKKFLLSKVQKQEKEVQTHENIPVWLQQPTAMPYPYNFIDAVKKKLNLAVQQINTYNVEPTADTVMSKPPTHKSVSHNIPSSEENQKPKLNALTSFLSHKCLNLDTKNLEPLGLTAKSLALDLQNIKFKPSHQQNSDSDTSKNIPDLSSENSVKHSTKRRHSSDTDDNKFKINVERIKKMKLHQPKRINFDAVDDFTAPNENVSEPDLNADALRLNHNQVSSGKESIISSNKCDYFKSHSTNTLSQMNKHDGVKSNSLKSSLKNLSNSEILTEVNSNENVATTSIVEKSKSNTPEESISPVKSQHSDVTKSRISKESLKAKSDTVISKDAEYSSNFGTRTSTSSLPSLKYPNASLKSSHSSLNMLKDNEDENNDKTVTNIILKEGEKTKTQIKTNEIHLKFEAELHLLNDFNDSLRQVMAVEKSLLELRDKKTASNDGNTVAPLLFTRDTQTSIVTKSTTDTRVTNNNNTDLIPTINYSRGSEVLDHTENFALENTDTNVSSLLVSGMELSQLQDNSLSLSVEQSNFNVSVRGDISDKSMMKDIPLEMFDQLIQDEDIRIENLKTILKIREKSLVDRTKAELAWLEVQKKQLKDSGQLQQISAIKKKQRGLLIKLEHERHEMQRLKQMQKIASKKRKSVLKEKRNMIKIQLSTNNVITKIKRNAKEEKRSTGPLKVYNIKSHSESVRSETSVSRRSSITEEIVSVVSQSKSIVSHIKEESVFGENPQIKKNQITKLLLNSQIEAEHIRRSLLMREEALQKRRQAAEELLQWHQRLIEEEKKIAELESAANAIINQTQSTVAIPTTTNSDNQNKNGKHKFKGSQLNILWSNMTGREEKKFNDKLTYSMSKTSLEQFCQDAKKAIMSHKLKSLNKKSENRANLHGESVTSETLKHKNDSNVDTKADSDYTLEFDSSYSITDELQSNKSILLTNELNEEISDQHVSEETIKSSVTDIIEKHSLLTEYLSNLNSVSEQITNNKSKLSSNVSQLLQHQTKVNSNKNEETEATSNQIASNIELITENSREKTDDGSNSEFSIDEEGSEISSEYHMEIESKSDKASNRINETSLISNIENNSNTENIQSEFSSDKKSSKTIESLNSVSDENSSTKMKLNSSEDQASIDSSKNEENTLIAEKLSEYDSKSVKSENRIGMVLNKEDSIIISTKSTKSEHSGSGDEHSSKTIVSSNVIDNEKSSTKLNGSQSEIKSNEEKSSNIEKLSSGSASVPYNIVSEDEIKSSLSQGDEKVSSIIDNEYSAIISEQNTTLNSIKENSSNKIEKFSSKSEIEVELNEYSPIISNYDTELGSKHESSVGQPVSIPQSDTKIASKSSVDEENVDCTSKNISNNEYLEEQEFGNSVDEIKFELSFKTDEDMEDVASEKHNESNTKSLLSGNDDKEASEHVSEISSNEDSKQESLESNNEDYQSASEIMQESPNLDEISSNEDIKQETLESHEENIRKPSEIEHESPNHDEVSSEEHISEISSNEHNEQESLELNNDNFQIQIEHESPNHDEVPFGEQISEIISNENTKRESLESNNENIQNASKIENESSNHDEVPSAEHISEISSNIATKRESSASNNENLQNASKIEHESSNHDEVPSDEHISVISSNEDTKQESLVSNNETLQNASEIEHESPHHDEVLSDNKVDSDSSIQELHDSEKNSVLQLSLKNETKSEVSTKNQNETLLPENDDEESIRKDVDEENDEQVSPNDSRNSSLHDIESLEKSYSEKFDNEDLSERNQEVTEINVTASKEECDNLQLEIESEESVTGSSKEDSPLLLSYGFIGTKHKEEDDDTLDSISNEDDASVKENVSVESNLDLTKKSAEDQDKIIVDNHSSKDDQVESEPIDVKRRVSEILADANIASPRGDRSPKLQNLYVTAYDIISPDHSPESDSPVEDTKLNFSPLPRVYGNDEVEELLKKQLAIEQEIKEIQQQQKEHLPYVYVREIPNKPPPPYKPPLISQVPDSESIIPSTDNQMSAITALSADVLHDAYINRKLENIKLSENLKSLLCNKHKIQNSCVTFVFDLCKEAAIAHYKQFTSNEGPSWMHLSKKSKLAVDNPLSKSSLEKSLNKRIDQWLGHEVVKSVENNKHKWSSKKRDHVDDLLVIECQTEESEWTNYDQDELVVKDELTKNIMDMLIDETAQLMNNILIKKKKSLC